VKARIYRPTKTAMQSGLANTRDWILEFVPPQGQQPDPLMGWSGHGDTIEQLRLRFPTQEEAVTYARRRGLDYEVETPQTRPVRPKAYADNFRFDRVR